LRGEPWTSRTLAAELEAQVEGQSAHEVLGSPARVFESPIDGELAQVAVVLVRVGAHAVLLVTADRVVVVAVDRRDRSLLDQGADLVRPGPIADQVAAAIDLFDAELLDPREGRFESRKVAVDVRDRRDGLVHSTAVVG
jgi:hypothetical protein